MKEFVVVVSHFIRGNAGSHEEAKEQMKTIMEEEIAKLRVLGFTDGKEWNPRMQVSVGVFKNSHESKVVGLNDTVSIEVGMEK